MINEALPFLDQAPWLAVLPAAAISSAVVGANLVGEGIREALALRQSLELGMTGPSGSIPPGRRSVLTVSDLRVTYRTRAGAVQAVKGVSLRIAPGRLLASWASRGRGRARWPWPCWARSAKRPR